MRRVTLWVDTGFAGGVHEEELEVDDECTDEELEAAAREFLFECVDFGWSEDEDDRW